MSFLKSPFWTYNIYFRIAGLKKLLDTIEEMKYKEVKKKMDKTNPYCDSILFHSNIT
jgi:hypothetical protein